MRVTCAREFARKSLEYADAIWTASILWSITSKLVRRQPATSCVLCDSEEIGTRERTRDFNRRVSFIRAKIALLLFRIAQCMLTTGSHRCGYVWLVIVVLIENFKRLTSPSAVIDRQSEGRFASSFLTFNVDLRWKQCAIIANCLRLIAFGKIRQVMA